MEGDLKQTFVLQCVQEYFQEVQAAMSVAIVRSRIGKTNELKESLSSKTWPGGKGAAGTLSFMRYGRFIDMGVGRSHPLGGLRATTVALKSSNRTGAVLQKSKIRKPKKFYSKVAYSKLNFLINKISYGFTEDMVKSMKQMETK